MKNLFAISLLLFALLCAGTPVQAQTAMSTTTLSVAITDPAYGFVTLASTTNVQPNGFLYVDGELMNVNTSYVAGTNPVPVRRGATPSASASRNHASGAVVIVARPGNEARTGLRGFSPLGSCDTSKEGTLPVWNAGTGEKFDCLPATGTTAQWIRTQAGGTMGGWTGASVRSFCTGTAGSAETEFLNGAACSGATTATARQVISSPGTLANLRVFSSAAFTGGTNKDVLTVFKNGSATALTCTAAGAATTCSDVAHSVAVAAGDVITFQFVSATSDTAANVSASVEKY